MAHYKYPAAGAKNNTNFINPLFTDGLIGSDSPIGRMLERDRQRRIQKRREWAQKVKEQSLNCFDF